jgi:hypothetical protein
VLKVKPLDTLFTSYDEPFWVDIESDRDTTVDVYVYGVETPFTSINVTKPYTRARVWSENPIASTPTNQAHKIIFKDRYTGEQVDVWIAYFRPRIERVELRPAKGVTLGGVITQLLIMGDLAFYRRIYTRRFALLDVTDHTKVFYEFYGFNENGEKFYFVERQDRILATLGGQTDLFLSLNPVENVLVTVEYEIPVLAPIIERIIPAVEKDNAVIRAFISAAGGIVSFIMRYPIGVARLIAKVLGINTDIVDVRISGNRLRVTYLVDAPVLQVLVLGLAALAGAALAYILVTSIRDVFIERERTYRVELATTMITEVNRERSKIINELLNYARENNLLPSELLGLLNAIGNLYSTPDITNAVNLLNSIENLNNEVEKLRKQLGEESKKKWIFALGGAGIGAVAAMAVRGK